LQQKKTQVFNNVAFLKFKVLSLYKQINPFAAVSFSGFFKFAGYGTFKFENIFLSSNNGATLFFFTFLIFLRFFYFLFFFIYRVNFITSFLSFDFYSTRIYFFKILFFNFFWFYKFNKKR
jgi:hypothetical protein